MVYKYSNASLPFYLYTILTGITCYWDRRHFLFLSFPLIGIHLSKYILKYLNNCSKNCAHFLERNSSYCKYCKWESICCFIRQVEQWATLSQYILVRESTLLNVAQLLSFYLQLFHFEQSKVMILLRISFKPFKIKDTMLRNRILKIQEEKKITFDRQYKFVYKHIFTRNNWWPWNYWSLYYSCIEIDQFINSNSSV